MESDPLIDLKHVDKLLPIWKVHFWWYNENLTTSNKKSLSHGILLQTKKIYFKVTKKENKM
jgi:hypothetical protein